jgi:hypothetical protein
MIPPAHALRACLALKLWSIERKSHVMALVADEGLALFSGLNATPKKSYLSEYSSRITPRQTDCLLAAWHDQLAGCQLLDGSSFNLDFHSVPYYGQDPIIEKHYVSARSRSQPGMLVFLAQDEHSQTFCYANADLRKGEEAEEIFRFITSKGNHVLCTWSEKELCWTRRICRGVPIWRLSACSPCPTGSASQQETVRLREGVPMLNASSYATRTVLGLLQRPLFNTTPFGRGSLFAFGKRPMGRSPGIWSLIQS